ncbi:myosin-12-like isoform X2 [Apium graveolens]|uniref:myosin-12-like isoform X2 n=1 Tax=Apium graveolens TaxID=4045 RepID=UPI003D793CC9
METLSTTEPHYIRCVKPNSVLKPRIFENFSVINQLRYGRQLESAMQGIQQSDHLMNFLNDSECCLQMFWMDQMKIFSCVAICDRMGLKRYQIWKTKVFLRAGQMAD